MTDKSELWRLSAVEAVKLLRHKEVSPVELVDAAIQRIEEVDDKVNALPIRLFEQAREAAVSWQGDRSDPRSLCGLPIAVKDYSDVKGARTTSGSPIFANHIAERSDATVRQLEAQGAVVLAKSNVPEWAGGNTFNPVFGATRNPWNLKLTVGGSSGGSAAALASGQVWLATGNDLGGSLRTPAAFCGVVGLRPSPGRVPRGNKWPRTDALLIEGPMGRCVDDVALMLDAEAGQQGEDPLTYDRPKVPYAEAIRERQTLTRVAFSPDLGVVPMEPEIAEICAKSVRNFESLGAEVTDEIPSFAGVLEAFQTQRAVLFANLMAPILEEHRESIAPEIIQNIEKGIATTTEQILAAERVKTRLYRSMMEFFETHDLLVCPTTSVEPFPVEWRYVESIGGKRCDTYIDWFAITFAITMTSLPTISVPCGFTQSGLPVGLQIVGKPRGEVALLSAARKIEEAVGIAGKLPINPK